MAWNGSDMNAKKTASATPSKRVSANTRLRRYLVVGLILVALGTLLVGWLLSGNEDANSSKGYENTTNRTSRIASAKAHAPTNVPVAAVTPPKRNVRMEKGVEVVQASVSTNRNGAEIEYLTLADGRTMRKIRPPKPLFENPADQLIALSLSAKPGQSMPPLPDLSNVDDDFAQAMLTPIRIEKTDSDEVRALKSKVIEARAYLVEEIKNGGTVREALRRYQADMEKFSDSHAMAAEQIKEIRKAEGEEAAVEFRNRINEAFRARGIPEIEVKESNGNKRNQKEQSNE